MSYRVYKLYSNILIINHQWTILQCKSPPLLPSKTHHFQSSCYLVGLVRLNCDVVHGNARRLARSSAARLGWDSFDTKWTKDGEWKQMDRVQMHLPSNMHKSFSLFLHSWVWMVVHVSIMLCGQELSFIMLYLSQQKNESWMSRVLSQNLPKTSKSKAQQKEQNQHPTSELQPHR